MSSFADRLNALFATFLEPADSPGRRPDEWSNATVARVVADLAQPDEKPVVTRQYLGMLRSGERTQPSLRAAGGIAAAFSELARRSGTSCTTSALLSYLAGEFPQVGQPATPEQVLAVVTGDGTGPTAVPYSGRAAGGDDVPQDLRAVEALIERLAQQDAEPVRLRLARLLGMRPTPPRPPRPHP